MSILPVKVSVHLLSKNLTLPELSLRPEDGLGVVLDHIMAAMEQRGDKIIKYGTDHALICFGSVYKYKVSKGKQYRNVHHRKIRANIRYLFNVTRTLSCPFFCLELRHFLSSTETAQQRHVLNLKFILKSLEIYSVGMYCPRNNDVRDPWRVFSLKKILMIFSFLFQSFCEAQ